MDRSTNTQQILEGLPENLREQLALAVRSIEWSYAILWIKSSRQPGVLEWGDGYYNGDIKTRKTVQSAELNADKLLGLERTEQLRELYESLSLGETNPQAQRPSAALSPEDLTDTEWYFLVCMSFKFNIGQGLPGRTLAKDQTIWLCNAHQADSKLFSRSLLAKSASIQTVVCFPYLGGTLELGVTELVLEDPSLIQHIRKSFLDIPYDVLSKNLSHVSDIASEDKDFASAKDADNVFEAKLDLIAEGDQAVVLGSPNNTSDDLVNIVEESYIVEGVNGEASQVQSWQLIDDEISNGIHNSTNSSDCVSQTYANTENGFPQSNREWINEIQENNQKKQSSDERADDIHYQGILSTLFKSSHQLILGPSFKNSKNESGFVRFQKENGQFKSNSTTAQRLLKKVLFEVARRHGGCLVQSTEENGKRDGVWRPEADEVDRNRTLSERRRREKMNERFQILETLVPCNGKVDRVSLLDETIEYLKQLKRKVEELESQKEVEEQESRTKRKSNDAAERTSDNYGTKRICKSRKTNKRKTHHELKELEPAENHQDLLKDSTPVKNLTVNVIDKDVLIELRCPWRESLLLEIMEAISSLHMDSQSVQSSNNDGILSATIKAKMKGPTLASAGMIKQELQRYVR